MGRILSIKMKYDGSYCLLLLVGILFILLAIYFLYLFFQLLKDRKPHNVEILFPCNNRSSIGNPKDFQFKDYQEELKMKKIEDSPKVRIVRGVGRVVQEVEKGNRKTNSLYVVYRPQGLTGIQNILQTLQTIDYDIYRFNDGLHTGALLDLTSPFLEEGFERRNILVSANYPIRKLIQELSLNERMIAYLPLEKNEAENVGDAMNGLNAIGRTYRGLRRDVLRILILLPDKQLQWIDELHELYNPILQLPLHSIVYVIAYEIRTHPVRKSMYHYLFKFPYDQTASVIEWSTKKTTRRLMRLNFNVKIGNAGSIIEGIYFGKRHHIEKHFHELPTPSKMVIFPSSIERELNVTFASPILKEKSQFGSLSIGRESEIMKNFQWALQEIDSLTIRIVPFRGRYLCIYSLTDHNFMENDSLDRERTGENWKLAFQMDCVEALFQKCIIGLSSRSYFGVRDPTIMNPEAYFGSRCRIYRALKRKYDPQEKFGSHSKLI